MCRNHDSAMQTQGQGHNSRSQDLLLKFVFSSISPLSPEGFSLNFGPMFVSLTMHGSRNICQGGGVQVSLTKKALTFFCLFFVFFKSSVYFTEVKWSISKKSIIFQGSRAGPTFSRRVQLFPGGGGGPIAYSL